MEEKLREFSSNRFPGDNLVVRMGEIDDPCEMEKVREENAGIIESRIQFMKQLQMIQLHLATIALTGVKTQSDLDLVIAMQMLPPTVKREPNGIPTAISRSILERTEVPRLVTLTASENGLLGLWESEEDEDARFNKMVDEFKESEKNKN